MVLSTHLSFQGTLSPRASPTSDVAELEKLAEFEERA
jgi:hypothetical protein